MQSPEDLTGQRFTRLIALEIVGRTKHRTTRWKCRCDCGVESVVQSRDLTHGHTRSCGCLQREITSARSITHGLSKSSTYNSWLKMRTRCNNKTVINYAAYGGRGIRVCVRWDTSFENFLADMGERPPNKTLDRIDNDGDYTPSNCRWATRSEQARNRRSTRMLTYDGRTQCLEAWADQLGINSVAIHTRLKRGWPLADALTRGPSKLHLKTRSTMRQ